MAWVVRQYRPAYFSGFETEIYRGEEVLEAPWLENFKYEGFDKFTVSPYLDDEVIVEAHYTDGKHFVAAFAIPETSKLVDEWRYKPHTQL